MKQIPGTAPEKVTAIRTLLNNLDGGFTGNSRTVDFGAYAELNAIFHDQLARLCQSNILQRELERAKSLPFASPSTFLLDKLDIEAFSRSLVVAQEQHRELRNSKIEMYVYPVAAPEFTNCGTNSVPGATARCCSIKPTT